jgi:hypothetical protein
MELPKIEYDDLPEEVKQKVDSENFEFKSLLDEDILLGMDIDWDLISNSNLSYAKRLIAQRKYVEEVKSITKKCQSGKITEEEAQDLVKEALERRNNI